MKQNKVFHQTSLKKITTPNLHSPRNLCEERKFGVMPITHAKLPVHHMMQPKFIHVLCDRPFFLHLLVFSPLLLLRYSIHSASGYYKRPSTPLSKCQGISSYCPANILMSSLRGTVVDTAGNKRSLRLDADDFARMYRGLAPKKERAMIINVTAISLPPNLIENHSSLP
jgi:hypothetical protein